METAPLPDIVYVVKNGDKNPELRYSLRSLTNLPHGKVWMAGGKPGWIRNVEHVPTTQRGNKFVNALKNLEAVLPQVSIEFVLMNDDFIILSPLERVPTLYMEVHGQTLAKQALVGVRKILARHGIEDLVSYELHVPFVYNRDLLTDTLEQARGVHIAGYQRTLYGNLNRIGGTLATDVKVRNRLPDGPFVSTSEKTFQGGVGQMIRQLFPEPSPFECV